MEASHEQQGAPLIIDEHMGAVIGGVLRLAESGLVSVDVASCAFNGGKGEEVDAAQLQMVGAALLSGDFELAEAMEKGLFARVRLETTPDGKPHLSLVPAIEEDEQPVPAPEPEPEPEPLLEAEPETVPEPEEPPVEPTPDDLAEVEDLELLPVELDPDDDGILPKQADTPLAAAPRFGIDKGVTAEVLAEYLEFGSDRPLPEGVAARVSSVLHNLKRYAAYRTLSHDQQVILRGLAKGESPNSLWAGDPTVYTQAVEMLAVTASGNAPTPLAEAKAAPKVHVVPPVQPASTHDVRPAAYGVDTRTTASYAPKLGLTEDFIAQVRRNKAEGVRVRQTKIYTVEEVMDPDWEPRGLCATGVVDIDELNVSGAIENDAAYKCGACPVKTECLAATLDRESTAKNNNISFVRGGLTSRRRRALKRKLPEGLTTTWWQRLGAAKAEYMTQQARKAPR